MGVSKILNDTDRVQPVEWRNDPLDDADGAGTEVSRLQKQLRQLVEASEQKARLNYENGLRAGEAAAAAAAETALHAAVERYTTAVAELSALRGETIRRAEADTVRLAIEIARRILHRELTMDTSALESLIRAALEKLQSQEVYRVRIHPDLERVVRGCLEQVGRQSAVEVIKDPIQPKGGAIFEISRGTLDASLDTQLNEIDRGLSQLLEEQP